MTATIINLSALIAMPGDYQKRIDKTINAFACELKLSPPQMLCSSALFSNQCATKAWVIAKYLLYKSSVIDAYKKGFLTTSEFLEKMAEVFPSLSKEAIVTAWNSLIDLDDKCVARIKRTFSEANDKAPLYLVSNSNELNIQCLLAKMRKSGIKLFDDINISSEDSQKPIVIAPNVYLCVSYRYGLFKAPSQLDAAMQNTQSLINHVATVDAQSFTQGDMMQLTLISQHEADRDIAKKLGIPLTQVLTDSEHFQDEFILDSVKTI